MAESLCLRGFFFDILNYKPVGNVESRGQFFKIKVVFHTFYLCNKVGDPHFFGISDTSNSLSDGSKIAKKVNYRLKNFRANVLNFSFCMFMDRVGSHENF